MAEFLTPDICVIGGGAGGLAVATKARARGLAVVLVERERLGGQALHAAALPSKALVAAARRAHLIRTAGAFGIANEQPKINARGVYDHVHEVVEAVAPYASSEHLLALGVTLIAGEGKFIDANTVEAGGQRIRAERFVIATGSRPVVPEIPGLADVPYFTSSTILDNPRKLSHVVVIGGGAVGIEMAQAFARLGSDVTVVEQGQAPLADYDPELTDLVLRRLREEGVTLRTGAEVTGVQARSLGIGVTVKSPGREETLDASHILVAAGRLPFLDELDLERAGVRFTPGEGRRLQLKPNLRTTNPKVYALGDAAGGLQRTPNATHQAELVLRQIAGGWPERFDPLAIPATLFTDPEIASVGLTEPEARKAWRPGYRVLRLSMAENDRARAERQTYGLVKVVTNGSGKLLGAGIVGSGAAEMISLFALAIGNGLTLRAFTRFVAPYPTLTEVVRQLADEASRPRGSPALAGPLQSLRRVLPWR